MLRLTKLTLQDFGPFKGQQSVVFPAGDGVIIVFGENMRGKTSLLNAIRYALFGKIVTRGLRTIGVHKVGNWEAALEGRYGFSVVLEFNLDDHRFELTRVCRPRQGVQKPTRDADYEEQRFLRRDGEVLGPAQTDLEISKVMPEQVSRFFLFDGELLQEYEELLRDESDMGRRIKDAIEQVLGVPILTNARADLREAHRKAQEHESIVAQRDQRTKELGTVLATLVVQQKHLEKETLRYTESKAALDDRKASLDATLRKNEKIGALLDERDKLRKEVETLEERKKDSISRRNVSLEDGWRTLLSRKVRSLSGKVQAKATELQDVAIERAVSARVRSELVAAIDQGQCNVCQQSIDGGIVAALRQKAQALPAEADSASLRDELKGLQSLSERLTSFRVTDVHGVIAEITRDLESVTVDIATKKDRIVELEEEVKDVDHSEFRKAKADYETTVKEVSLVEEALRGLARNLVEVEQKISNVEQQLERTGGADAEKARKKRELLFNLFSLMNDAVGVFRDTLRTRVEHDASDLFRKLTTDPDYVGLRINENYGLTIVHRDGQDIPVRSAGAEHIVALSLMGALQHNAPLRGPIIMDSPFGRLDDNHTTKVVRALPDMASQVLLLVHEHELQPPIAREQLKGALKYEYRLNRKSARHTTIDPYIEEGQS